jgi:hypothetical protein
MRIFLPVHAEEPCRAGLAAAIAAGSSPNALTMLAFWRPSVAYIAAMSYVALTLYIPAMLGMRPEA